MSAMQSIADGWAEALDQAVPHDVAGVVAGVRVGGEQFTLARGIANLNTGQEFAEDTGFLLGSVTKLLTTTILMRLVERGQADLDAPARRYVPEFTLRDRDAAERITVRMLVNHTNGMDADTLMPTGVRGRDASRSYTEALANLGVLFEPGAGIHYTNPGFVVAARVIEECTGLPFERAIQEELFDPSGMQDATAVQTQAFLRRTAVGAFADPDGKTLRATAMFTLPESAAGAGATPIVTVADMLTFGRMHLNGGVAPNGRHILSRELAGMMLTPTYDLGIPSVPPIGLGWWLYPIAGTTAARHGGGSPGGTSSFTILPEYDTAIISFANGPGGTALNDRLHSMAIEAITGRQVSLGFETSPVPVEEDIAGEYVSFQRRVIVEVEGEEIVMTDRYEPYDEEHRRNHDEYRGRGEDTSRIRYRSVAPGLFAPVGMAPEALSGSFGLMALLATLPAAPGRRPGLHAGRRYIPRVG